MFRGKNSKNGSTICQKRIREVHGQEMKRIASQKIGHKRRKQGQEILNSSMTIQEGEIYQKKVTQETGEGVRGQLLGGFRDGHFVAHDWQPR